jgi:hypothetical protein
MVLSSTGVANIGVLSWLLNAGGLVKIVFPLNACEVAQIRC